MRSGSFFNCEILRRNFLLDYLWILRRGFVWGVKFRGWGGRITQMERFEVN